MYYAEIKLQEEQIFKYKIKNIKEVPKIQRKIYLFLQGKKKKKSLSEDKGKGKNNKGNIKRFKYIDI